MDKIAFQWGLPMSPIVTEPIGLAPRAADRWSFKKPTIFILSPKLLLGQRVQAHEVLSDLLERPGLQAALFLSNRVLSLFAAPSASLASEQVSWRVRRKMVKPSG
jgi:hypothetical protein